MVDMDDESELVPETLIFQLNQLSVQEQCLVASRSLSRVVWGLPLDVVEPPELLAIFRAFLVVAYQGSSSAINLVESVKAIGAREGLRSMVKSFDADLNTSVFDGLSGTNELTVQFADGLVSKSGAASTIKSAYCAVSRLVPGVGAENQAALSVLFARIGAPPEMRGVFATNTYWDINNVEQLSLKPTRPTNWTNEHLIELDPNFVSHLKKNSAWVFWLRFYQQFWSDTFTDWDLALKVIQIDEEDWAKGYDHIGEVIAEIEARLRNEPLDQDALRSHLNNVLEFPLIHRDFAEGTGKQIETAITAYKIAAPSNTLPDGFQTFEALPTAFESIAGVLRSDREKNEKIAVLQAEVNQLHSTIAKLRLELSEAKAALASGRLDALEVAQMRTFGEKTQTFLTNLTLCGAIGMGMFAFFGVSEDQLKYETLKAQMDDLAEQMQAVEEEIETVETP